jgi:hypothetical protein
MEELSGLLSQLQVDGWLILLQIHWCSTINMPGIIRFVIDKNYFVEN